MVKEFKIVLNAPAQGVFFSESSGSGENQTTHTYTSNETCINLRVIVWTKEQVPTQELHAGIEVQFTAVVYLGMLIGVWY